MRVGVEGAREFLGEERRYGRLTGATDAGGQDHLAYGLDGFPSWGGQMKLKEVTLGLDPLQPAILSFCAIGIYSIDNDSFDI